MKRISTRAILLFSVVIQVLHSTEEFLLKFYDEILPAQYLREHFPEYVRPGFIAINILFISFGLYCFWRYSRKPTAKTMVLVWIWVVIETINGLAHVSWGLLRGDYIPGLVTALVLLPVAMLLMIRLKREGQSGSPGGRDL